ncbi:MAG: alpha-galactosidase [Pseudomonadota bacterium]
MGNTTISKAQHWRIDSAATTCLITADRGMPRMLYWGKRLADDEPLDALAKALERPAVPGSLDIAEALTLLPEGGTGFSGHPGIVVHRNGAHSISQLQIASVKQTAYQIEFTCSEQAAEFSVALTLALDPHSGVLSFRNSIQNEGHDDLHVDWFASAVLPLPASHCETWSMTGRWAQEFRLQRVPIGHDALVRCNRMGRTSHASFPGMVTGSQSFSAEQGDVVAMHLAWSGNHRVMVARARDGLPLAQLGVLLSPGETVLAPGDAWQAPVAHFARSDDGYNACMQAMHRFVRHHVLTASQQETPRLVHYNTWEACYFDHSEAKTLALVKEAKAMGAERFILDDGWFECRNDDTAGLGNWSVDTAKYPNGLEPIFDAVRKAGMQPGLWIEPEMINADSDTFREHPEWVLGDPNREQPLGRNQYVLNLCLPEVFDFLLGHILNVIRRYQLGYLKWDMNRDLTHAIVNHRQGSEKITRAVYRLLAAVRTAHPEVEIEVCSSGGARADFGALSHGDRIWTSDNHDPHDRQRIQHGFSLFFPPEVMGAHVGSQHSDTTGRQHSMAFRIANALVGHFGVEPNKSGLSDQDIAVLKSASDWYKSHRDWLHAGETSFMAHPEQHLIVRREVSDDRRRALIIAALLDTPEQAVLAPIRCTGLQPELSYRVSRVDPETFVQTNIVSMRGDSLAQTGFQPPLMQADSAVCWLLEAVDG